MQPRAERERDSAKHQAIGRSHKVKEKTTMLCSMLLILMALGPGLSTAFAQSYLYDDAGRLIRVAYPRGSGIAYMYDASDNLMTVLNLSLPIAPTQLTVDR